MYSAGVARDDFGETAEERTAIEALIMNNQDILSNDRSTPAKPANGDVESQAMTPHV